MYGSLLDPCPHQRKKNEKRSKILNCLSNIRYKNQTNVTNLDWKVSVTVWLYIRAAEMARMMVDKKVGSS